MTLSTSSRFADLVIPMGGAADSTSNTDANGEFSANVRLLYTNDGTTLLESGFAIAPAYVGNNLSSTSRTYTFAGSLSNVRGVRVVGQVRTAILMAFACERG